LEGSFALTHKKNVMTDTNMPAAEAVGSVERELHSYELAFHVLPTVAEGEVKGVFDAIKAHITKLGGTPTEEEMPARFDLAYDIVKFLEGRNRKFKSAYFGWVRFDIEADKIAEINEMMDGSSSILRYILIRLTKVEAEHSFLFHPAIADRVVETIIVEAGEGEVIEDVVEETEEKLEDGEATKEAV
jgi:ribosomal protein S6